MVLKNKVYFSALKPEHREGAVKLVLQNFLKNEPACKHLRMKYFPEHDIHAEMYFNEMADQGLSFVAVDRETNQVVGVLFNTEYYPDRTNPLSEVLEKETDECKGSCEFKRFLSVYEQNRSVVPDIFRHYGVDRCFYFGFLCVNPEYSNMGIATTLVKLSEEHAKSLGHRLCIVDATAGQTKHICVNKLGFNVLGEMKYKDFEFYGDKPLTHVNENETMQYVAKKY